jgi:hypothetical protein
MDIENHFPLPINIILSQWLVNNKKRGAITRKLWVLSVGRVPRSGAIRATEVAPTPQ